MKRYYTLLFVLAVFVVAIGINARRAPAVVRVVATPAPPVQPTAVPYHKEAPRAEPFLYAVPLGYFTPYGDLSVFEWPGASAPVVGSLKLGEKTGYTSEYHTAEGETWLCVQWDVDQEVMGWECTGWALASMGKVEREREYAPEVDDAKEQA